MVTGHVQFSLRLGALGKQRTTSNHHKRVARMQGQPAGRSDGLKRDSQHYKVVLVVAAALINDQGKVLLAQRPPGKKLAGLWEFPGGKVEAGETPELALARELKEELNLQVEPDHLSPVTFASVANPEAGFTLLMPLYACWQWVGTPKGLEGQQLAWVPSQELAAWDMVPADLPLIPAIQHTVAARESVGSTAAHGQ